MFIVTPQHTGTLKVGKYANPPELSITSLFFSMKETKIKACIVYPLPSFAI